jgi:hypothetical protein
MEVAQTRVVGAHHVGGRWSGSSESNCMQAEQKTLRGSAEVKSKVWLAELVVLMLDLTGSCELRGAQFCIGIAPPSPLDTLQLRHPSTTVPQTPP